MLQKIAVYLILFYQSALRMFLPFSCRFTPSCSEYTKQAVIKYGFLKGGFKGIKRLLTCHPFSGKAGFDPLL